MTYLPLFQRRESPPVSTPTPALTPTTRPRGEMVMARVSHYTPWTGGPNCALYIGGQCLSRMASGARWDRWIDRACACPPEYPFGTTFMLPDGSEWVCMDRGSRIVIEPGGVIWLDLLTARTKYKYGELVTVEVLR
jgi:hypothetical protein